MEVFFNMIDSFKPIGTVILELGKFVIENYKILALIALAGLFENFIKRHT